MHPEVVIVARNETIADLVMQCAKGELPFSGPDSLYSKVIAMGYNGNSLYEMVVATEYQLKEEQMTMFDKIKREYLNARKEKNKDSVKINLYSSLISDISMVGKNDGNREPTDAECINIIKKYIKNAEVVLSNLKDKEGSREMEARDDAECEIMILNEWLPKQLEKNQLTLIISNFFEQNSDCNMGHVMSYLKTNYSGRYDGKLASAIVKEYF